MLSIMKGRAVEEVLEKKVGQLYRDCLGHELANVSCKLTNDLDLMIFMEGVRSPLESFLAQQGKPKTAQEVNITIGNILIERLSRTLIEEMDLSVCHIVRLRPFHPDQMSLIATLDG
ncbi:MAG: Na-translocating system protein MpsC family protein [Phormidesmis sp.]